MEIGPIWRALLLNKSSYLLIALQIAVTMALMVNAISIVQERTRLMARPSGVDEDNIFQLYSSGFDPQLEFQAMVAEDLDAIRNFPGVVNAVMTNSVPLRQGGWSQGLKTEPGDEDDDVGVAIYFVDQHGIETFGVDLIAGRNYQASDIAWFDPDGGPKWPGSIIITSAMASELFPDITAPEQAVGKVAYIENYLPVTIIGVIDRMQAPWKGWSGVERSMMVPLMRGEGFARYVIRTEPGQRDQVIPQIEKMLAESKYGRIIDGTSTMTEIRHRAYFDDSAMIKLLDDPASRDSTLKKLLALRTKLDTKHLLPRIESATQSLWKQAHSDQARLFALQLAGAFRLRALDGSIAQFANSAEISEALKLAALRCLRELGSQEVETLTEIAASQDESQAIRDAAFAALAESSAEMAAPAIASLLTDLDYNNVERSSLGWRQAALVR